MRELLNLFSLVFGLALGAVVVLLWAAPAHAVDYPAPEQWLPIVPSGYPSDDAVGACGQLGGNKEGYGSVASGVLTLTSWQMQKTYSAQCLLNTTYKGTIAKGWVCPVGASFALVGGSWQCLGAVSCPAGLVDQNGQCLSECALKAGQTHSAGMYDLGIDDNAMPVTSACDGSCESGYNGSGVVARQMVGGEYHYFSEGAYVFTGAECTEGNPVPNALSSMPPPSCDPVTQDSGEVNGKTVCLDKYIPPDTVEESPEVQNPDGSTTKTTTTTDGQTGDQTISTTTTQPDGTKTTTTTTTPAPSGPAGDFCKLHPADPSCRDPKDGRWDGKGTGKGFGEDGDVVAAKAAVGLKIAEIRDSIAAKFGSAGAMSGEIPCDSVQVLGQSFSVCLSAHQSTFDMIGSALLAVALIIAFLMVLM